MSTSPRVSVVVPTYNSAAYLAETIESLFAQTYADWELIIVDDGSTDDTMAVIGRYTRGSEKARAFTHPNRANRGTLATRALGAQRARGQVVALLDADDLWDPNYLENHLGFWDMTALSAGAAMSYGPAREWDPTTGAEHVAAIPPCGVHAPPSLLSEWLRGPFLTTPGPSGVFLRRGAYAEVHHYEKAAQGSCAEDQYLNLHIAARYPIAIHDGPWWRYRLHPTSAIAQRTTRAKARDHIRLFETIQPDLVAALGDDPIVTEQIPQLLTELRRSASVPARIGRAIRHPLHATTRLLGATGSWANHGRDVGSLRSRAGKNSQ